MKHVTILVLLFPLLGALLCPIVSRFYKNWGKRIVIFSLFVSVVCGILQLVQVVKNGEPLHYWIGNYKPPYGIEFVIDGVNGLLVILVGIIGCLTALYSSPMESQVNVGWLRSAGYYSLVCFLAVGLLGMTSTGDVFNYYVFMEITALTGYGLIAYGEGKGPIAAFRYLTTGTIAASLYLMGIAFLYARTGSLNMADISQRIANMDSDPVIIVAIACLIVSFGIKMALFPLHGWQPGAHSYANPAADPMIAGIMIKIPAYAMMRYLYCIFKNNSEIMEKYLFMLGILAIGGILYGSLQAIKYDVYNKVLAYSSIGQVGYIALGIATGSVYGLVGAVLHMMSHAFMKAGLFYTSGAIKYRYSIFRTNFLGQIYRKMPLTGWTIVVLSLSMIGLPPFAGFFSKWYLALGAIESKKYIFVAVLIASSLLNAIYFFRIIERIFMGEDKELRDKYAELVVEKETQRVGGERKSIGAGASEQSLKGHAEDAPKPKKKMRELPWHMMVPIGVCAAAVILIGLFNSYIVSGILKDTLLEVFIK